MLERKLWLNSSNISPLELNLLKSVLFVSVEPTELLLSSITLVWCSDFGYDKLMLLSRRQILSFATIPLGSMYCFYCSSRQIEAA